MTKLTEVTCPNCKTKNSIRSNRSETLICSSCGAVIDLQTTEILQGTASDLFIPQSELALGLKGQIDQEEIEVVGVILYQGSDDEDTWQWEEWFGVGKSGYYWIQYDYEEDSYTVFRQITPTHPIDIQDITPGSHLSISPDDKFLISEVALAQTKSLAGEIPWKAKIGDVYTYADGHYYQHRYSVEWAEDEIEVYKGREIIKKELYQIFQMTDRLEQLIREERAAINWGLMRGVLWLVVIISLVGWAMAAISGRPIFTAQVLVCPDPIPNQPPVNIPCEDTPMPLGPIKLDKPNSVYKLHLTSHTANTNNWVTLDINLLDKSQTPISGLQGDFWVENWYEDGESGTDTSLEAERLFQLTEAGEYYLDMEGDKEAPNLNADTFTIKIYRDILLARYFIVLGSLALIVLGLKDGWFKAMLKGD